MINNKDIKKNTFKNIKNILNTLGATLKIKRLKLLNKYWPVEIKVGRTQLI